VLYLQVFQIKINPIIGPKMTIGRKCIDLQDEEEPEVAGESQKGGIRPSFDRKIGGKTKIVGTKKIF
jgi:hypothetical protein